jgi:hypothetical protein
VSGDQPPVEPQPSDERPVQPPASDERPVQPPASDEPTAPSSTPRAQPLVPGPPVPPPPWAEPPPLSPTTGPPPTRPVLPPGPGPQEVPALAPIHWALVLVGMPIGFVTWAVGSVMLLSIMSSTDSSVSNSVAVAVLVVLLMASIGLIVWKRTRRLAQGFVLGLAIGLVVAGGLCVPLVSSVGF